MSQSDVTELRGKCAAAKREEGEARAKLKVLTKSIEQLDASIAAWNGRPPVAQPGAPTALLAEIERLEAAIVEKEHELRSGPDEGSTLAHERLVEEYQSLHRTVCACLRRNTKLASMVGELGDPTMMVRKQETASQKRDEAAALEVEIRQLEREVKRMENQLSQAAALRKREGDAATSEVRKVSAEMARLSKLCATAESEAAAAQQQLDTALNEEAICARLTERLGEALRLRIAEHAESEPPPDAGVTPTINGGDAAEPVADVAFDVDDPDLVGQLVKLQRRHARIFTELERRRRALEAERTTLAGIKERAQAKSLDINQ
jgi:chromosome segregation ATPase